MFGMQSINLNCFKIVMLSATWKPFHFQLLNDIFGQSTYDYFSIPSALNICKPKSQACQINEISCEDGSIYQELRRNVSQNYLKRPIVVFVEKEDPKVE